MSSCELTFLRFFENLVNFTIEFRGPDMQQIEDFPSTLQPNGCQKLYTLAKALKSLVCIETIDFGYDHLDDDCGLGLLELFRQTNSIKSLELEHNLIGAHALHFLAIGISQFGGQLEYLGLGGNPWHKSCDTQHITNLSLSTSQITETAIRCCIANEFLNHPRLRSLDMRAVPISEQAAIEILQTLQSNTTILKFDVRDCQLDPIWNWISK
ncbi:unnamed protein product [Ceratitis capitata]|uniref:(Mediterranean fruit fly) hypothetical protein n=1 Tax=Ceratitis capitata TaxID=7213 RepID=A0A811VMS7_CERCA|nr:unnamed protein product [Ceratitis capitata]